MGSRTQGKSHHWQKKVFSCQKSIAKQRKGDDDIGSTQTDVTYSQWRFFSSERLTIL